MRVLHRMLPRDSLRASGARRAALWSLSVQLQVRSWSLFGGNSPERESPRQLLLYRGLSGNLGIANQLSPSRKSPVRTKQHTVTTTEPSIHIEIFAGQGRKCKLLRLLSGCCLHQHPHRSDDHIAQNGLRLLRCLQSLQVALRCGGVGSAMILEIIQRAQPRSSRRGATVSDKGASSAVMSEFFRLGWSLASLSRHRVSRSFAVCHCSAEALPATIALTRALNWRAASLSGGTRVYKVILRRVPVIFSAAIRADKPAAAARCSRESRDVSGLSRRSFAAAWAR